MARSFTARGVPASAAALVMSALVMLLFAGGGYAIAGGGGVIHACVHRRGACALRRQVQERRPKARLCQPSPSGMNAGRPNGGPVCSSAIFKNSR
jgi:hypothetical protein